ncbi:DUF4190 domain-containing protein [Janibacter sp. G368]|uniref:DUF4190 domain-containing protein n=1 Tax=Janibacter sp. G368 TaxID=3420441 RepID=UPI003D00EF7A
MTQQPGPYAPSPYPFPQQRAHGTATAALVLGIVGLTVVPGLGILAWVLGASAMKEIDANPQAWSNRDHAKVGTILGMVGTAIFAVFFLLGLLYFIGVIVFVATAPGA